MKPPSIALLLRGRALINVANIHLLMALWAESSLAKIQSLPVKMWPVTIATDTRPIHQRQAPSHSHLQTVLTVLIHLSPATLIPSLLHSLLHPLPIPRVLIGAVKGTLTALTQESRGFTPLADSEAWLRVSNDQSFGLTPLDLQVNDAAFRFWRLEHD